MPGLLDPFGGADPSSLLGDPQQQGLLGFLAGLQKSGALNYEAPFLSGRVPGGFAAGLAGGAGGLLAARDAYANRAKTLAETGKLGLEGQMLQANTGLLNAALNDRPPPMFGPGGATPTAAAPTATASGAAGGGLLPLLGQAVEQVESNGDPKAVSPAGAIGLRQIMPSTAADYGVTDKDTLFDPTTNRQLGDKILGDLSQRYGGDLDATLVAYNAGPKVADRFITAGRDPSVLPAETRAYLPKVKDTLASLRGGGAPASGGLLAAGAPAAPAGGLLAQAAPMGGLLSSPAAAASGPPAMGAPGPMVPGGIDPAYIAWAQRNARINAALGRQTPADVAEAAKLPLVGPTAAATAEAQNASKLRYEPLIQGAAEAAKNPPLIARAQGEQAAIGNREINVERAKLGLEPIRDQNSVLKEEYQKNVVEPFNAAQKAMVPLTAIENAMNDFRTGPTAETRLRAERVIQDASQAIGIDAGLAKRVAAGEVITKEGTSLGFELARTLGSREAQMIVQQAIASNPGLANSPGGNEKLIALIKSGLQRDIDKRAFVDQWFNKNLSYSGATEAFNKVAPVEKYVSQVLPFQPKNAADYDKLPAGTRYIKDGQIFEKRTAR